MHWNLADGSLCLEIPPASAARPSLLWRTRVCSFKDPAFTARSKGLLAGINYTPGLLCLPDYLQLLHPGASPQPREGEAPSAPPPPLPEGKQGVTANATWSGRHFSQIPAVMVPMALPVTSHWGSQQSPAWGEERKKGEKKIEIKNCCQQRPICSQCPGFAFKTLAGHSKKAIPHGAARLWGRRMGQGAGAQVTEPVQALPWL